MSFSYYQSIDEFLGARESRYFGFGYVNTKQVISDFSLAENGETLGFSCIGSVLLPDVWSAKGGSMQKPHLSSIDAIEFAIECLGRVFHQAFPGDEFSIELVEKMEVFAGKDPVEECLEAIPLNGSIRESRPGTYLLEMEISSMKVSLVFLRELRKSQFVVGQEKQSIVINDLMLNEGALNASAIVLPDRKNITESWALSSCFAAGLQLGQVLLYKLDNLSREASNTLWMRRLSIVVSPGIPALDMPQPIYTKLKKVKKLHIAREDWRCATISSIMCNTHIDCDVAHKV
ncbi:avrd-related protein [Herbaspirillum sp. C7C8]|nr:avrd-related protein [Herbaspirillum sp. C7C8]